MVNKTPFSKLAELTNLSKSYISQVKKGKKAISSKMLVALSALLPEKKNPDYLALFLHSRQSIGVTNNTIEFYKNMLAEFIATVHFRKGP